MMPSEEESLDGQEQQRTRTASQETVVQDSGVARYAKPPKTPPPPRPTAPVGSVPGPDFKKVMKKLRRKR